MVVMFEVDACLPREGPAGAALSASAAEDALSDQLSRLDIQAPTTSGPPVPSMRGRDAKPGGHSKPPTRGGPHIEVEPVSQDAIVELTTAGKLDWARFKADFYPQLFFGQTPHHFQGIHDGDSEVPTRAK